MPYTPTTPESATVTVESTHDLDTFHIHMICINVDPNDAAQTLMIVEWSEGYMDNGDYVANSFHKSKLSGQSLLNKMAEIAPNGLSYYDVVKKGVWDLMAAEGLVPAGTIA